MLNTPAPLLSLTADDGNVITIGGANEKKTVLYFYPKDDTPGCTLEAKDFRDMQGAFLAAGATIYGVSRDSIKKHCAFRDKYELNFRLLADEDGKACEAFGVWVEKSMYGKTYMGIERATFLINEQGIITHIWRNVKVTGHAAEVLAAVAG
jgi:thioredoxin-dependent peroxiredoxin